MSGSFQKHLPQVEAAAKELKELGIEVLSPPPALLQSVHRGFARLGGDPSKELRMPEDRHLDAISASDFVWFTGQDGYIGPSSAFELGLARGLKVPAFASSSINDVTLREYVARAHRARDVLRLLRPISGQRETSLLLDPASAIMLMQRELDRIAAIYASQEPPLDIYQSSHVRHAAKRLVSLLGNLVEAPRTNRLVSAGQPGGL